MKRILCVFGTRPEAIKMAPVVLALAERPREFRTRVVVTAQHRGMLDQVLALFRIRPRHDLDLMRAGQSLTDVTTLGLARLEKVFRAEKPDLVLVHGGTTTTLAASLAAFYQRIPVGHVEAGLRSFDPANPYPEEINRRLTDAVAALHFAPTASARRNLLAEKVPAARIFVTGNTGIDALHIGLDRLGARSKERGGGTSFKNAEVARLFTGPRPLTPGPLVLITAHRRENFGRPLADFCAAVRLLAEERPGVSFLYPVHPNPNVAGPVTKLLRGLPNVHLLPPLDYGDFLLCLSRAFFVVTDSGGLQEEAPALGKPVLVLRKVTERPEAVQAGTVRIVGTDTAVVARWMRRLLDDRTFYRRMARAVNPYGDGRAAGRTVEAIRYHFGFRPGRPPQFR